MLRTFACAVMALLIGVAVLFADEAKGKVKKYEKGTLTVTVGNKDQEFKLSKDAKVFDGNTEVTGKDRKTLLKELKEGKEVTVIYDKEGDKVTVKEVKFKK